MRADLLAQLHLHESEIYGLHAGHLTRFLNATAIVVLSKDRKHTKHTCLDLKMPSQRYGTVYTMICQMMCSDVAL